MFQRESADLHADPRHQADGLSGDLYVNGSNAERICLLEKQELRLGVRSGGSQQRLYRL